MVDARDDVRRVKTRLRSPATLLLLIVNALVFFYQYYYLPQHYHGYRGILEEERFVRWYALSLSGLKAGRIWQLLTYQFMHGGWLHILANSWAIYLFGGAVEETLGKRRMLTMYFISGVVGGLLQVLFAALMPGNAADAPVVGASAGAFGLVAGFTVLYPNQRLLLLLFFRKSLAPSPIFF